MGRTKKTVSGGASILRKYYSTGRYFLLLSDDIMEHPAFVTLKPLAKLILLDLMRRIREEFLHIELYKAERVPFTYTYAMSRVQVSQNTFNASMHQLVNNGWIDIKPEDQVEAVASPAYYRISERWKQYQYTAEQRREVYGRCDKKDKRLKKDYEHKSKIHCEKHFPSQKVEG